MSLTCRTVSTVDGSRHISKLTSRALHTADTPTVTAHNKLSNTQDTYLPI